MKRLMLWAIALVGASLSWGGTEDVASFDDDPAKYWNLDELSKTPSYRVSPHEESDWKGLQALLVKGKGPKGAEAEFFAYYGRPEGPVPEGGFPGVVLVHGGGGTAYPNYTEEWVKEGFAVLALDWYNQRPAMGLTNASPTEVSVPRVPLAGGRRQDHVANVANMVLAHSLLRSFPEVNRDRTVFVGLSWGSWYGAIVAAVDDRFKGCVEIYCGDKDVGRAGGRALINGRFLHAAKVPMWWAVSTNDKNVTPYTSQAGWDACAKFSGATIVNRLPHSHVGFTFPSVKRMAKHFAGLAKPLPRLVDAKVEGDCATARIADPGDGVVRATLNYTLSSDPKTDLRRWESVPAEICGETVRATLPAGTVQCYLSAYEAGTSRFDDLCGSTAFLTLAPTATKEEPYAFRKRLETVHEPNRRDPSLQPTADEFAFADGMAVGDADFADYLRTSMNVKATEGRRGAVWTAIDGSLREREYEIEVRKEGVEIRAADKRTLHQAYYHLEDLMNLRRAPFLKFGKERRRSLFSPRMVHSGWALDKFPDGHLRQMAHAGLDAILVFVKDADTTQGGGAHAGVNDIIDRALACGIDTYLYSKVRGFAHPDDPKGAELLRESFGRVAAAHPRAKGVVFVGESCEFPSRDERTCGLSYKDKRPAGETRPLPGWFPCRDYPDWLNAVKKALHENAPDMEIVFWTYNWSRQPPELCADLIPHFPDGVAVQGTFGKGENLVHRNGLENRCCDYTISEPGPTRHFTAEAIAAKKGGRKLYAMTNTGGMTWDYGVVPYQPCPYQWKKRWDALARAQKEWGLSGLMESHHYGWYPSFISELAKEAYTEGGMPFDEHIRKIAVRDFGEENADEVLAIWKRWSEAAADYVATNENQYGPFRLGPAYPFNFGGEPIREGEFPQDPSATHVMRWMAYLNYPYDQQAADMLNITFSPLPGGERGREKELALMESMYAAWNEGAAQLCRIAATLDPFRRAVAERQAGVGEWHARTILTALNLKRGYAAFAKGDKAKLLEYARAEYANAQAAIRLVERDSRLGWEPSMEYGAGVPQLRWKIERMKLVFGENALK